MRLPARAGLLLLLAGFLPGLTQGQVDVTTDAELLAKLQGQQLFLREGWRDDKLHFNASGQLIGNSTHASFTLSGVNVTEVHRSGSALEIKGQRFGLVFAKGKPPRETELILSDMFSKRPERVRLLVDLPVDGSAAPLDTVFVHGLEELLPLLPKEWRPYGEAHFGPHAAENAAAQAEAKTAAVKAAAGDAFPRLIYQVDPRFTREAQMQPVSGETVIEMQVDTAGLPHDFTIKEATGLGLDEAAVLAVAGYRFKPAMRAGVPVDFTIDVSVKFETK